MKLFLDYFNDMVTTYPDNIAIKSNNVKYSYREVNNLSNRLANYLSEKQYSHESLIGVLLEPSAEAVIVLLAIWKAGLAYLPLNIQETAVERLAFFVKEAEPKIIITSKTLLKKPHPLFGLINFNNNQFFTVDDIKNLNFDSEFKQKFDVEPERRLAYVIYTSGSTGEPKGVMIEHKGLGHILQAHIDIMKITTDDIIAQIAPHGFDAHIMEIMMALGTGATLYPVPASERLHLTALGKIYTQENISIGIFTPSILTTLKPTNFPTVRALLLTGEKLEHTVIKSWLDPKAIASSDYKKKLIINGYGPSETTIGVSLGICESEHIHAGKPISNLDAFIVKAGTIEEENLEPIESGDGILIIFSEHCLARGYLNKPELTNQRFRELVHPKTKKRSTAYITGDICCFEKGNLVIKGRNDRQFKVHGKLISPEEIENVIRSVESQLTNVFVTYQSNEKGSRQIIAYLETEQNINVVELHKKISRYLHLTMVPSRFGIKAKFPITNNGKIDYKGLCEDKSILLNYVQAEKPILPRYEIEEIITQVFEEILQLKIHDPNFNYRVTDNFAQLGGSSIQAALVLQKINEKFKHQKLSLEDFNQHLSIDAIAHLVYWSSSECLKFPLLNLMSSNGSSASSKRYPLFFIHSLTGDGEFDYKKLFSSKPMIELMKEYEFYQITYPAIKAKSEQDLIYMPNNMSTLAAIYNQEVLKVINSKVEMRVENILLLGWSAGGIIANEMARQLAEKQKSVAVFAIDSTSPNIKQEMNEMQFAEGLKDLTPWLLKYLNLPEQIIDVKELALSHYDKAQQIERLITRLKNDNNFSRACAVKNILLAMLNNEKCHSGPAITLAIASNTAEKFANKDRQEHHAIGWPAIKIQKIHKLEGDDHFSIFSNPVSLANIVSVIEKFCRENIAKHLILPLNRALINYYQSKPFLKLKRVIGASSPQAFNKAYIQQALLDVDAKNTFINDIFDKGDKVCISGVAGVGKSTWCNYLATQWAAGKWAEETTILMLIPLRNLHTNFYAKNEKITLASLLKIEIMDKISTQKLSNDNISGLELQWWAYLDVLAEKTIVILDGLDDLPQEELFKQAILDLLSIPGLRVITTGRPYSYPDFEFQSYYQLDAFRSQDVKQYIENYYATDQETAKSIQQYLKKLPSQLLNHPLTLEIFCYSWYHLNKDSKLPISNLTNIYCEALCRLISKYIERYKSQQGTFFKSLEQSFTRLEKLAKPELLALQKIAFQTKLTGAISLKGIIEIIDEMYRHEVNKEVDLLNDLSNLGLINPRQQPPTANTLFDFTHQTLLDFFAARHWCDCFKQDEEQSNIEALTILYENKYNENYEIMWWFCAGLLGREKNESYLEGFFNCLLQAPYDAVGSQLVLLLIRCISEADNFDNKLVQFMLLKLDEYVANVLPIMPFIARKKLLSSISQSNKLSARLLNTLIQVIGKSSHKNKMEIIREINNFVLQSKLPMASRNVHFLNGTRVFERLDDLITLNQCYEEKEFVSIGLSSMVNSQYITLNHVAGNNKESYISINSIGNAHVLTLEQVKFEFVKMKDMPTYQIIYLLSISNFVDIALDKSVIEHQLVSEIAVFILDKLLAYDFYPSEKFQFKLHNYWKTLSDINEEKVSDLFRLYVSSEYDSYADNLSVQTINQMYYALSSLSQSKVLEKFIEFIDRNFRFENYEKIIPCLIDKIMQENMDLTPILENIAGIRRYILKTTPIDNLLIIFSKLSDEILFQEITFILCDSHSSDNTSPNFLEKAKLLLINLLSKSENNVDNLIITFLQKVIITKDQKDALLECLPQNKAKNILEKLPEIFKFEFIKDSPQKTELINSTINRYIENDQVAENLGLISDNIKKLSCAVFSKLETYLATNNELSNGSSLALILRSELYNRDAILPILTYEKISSAFNANQYRVYILVLIERLTENPTYINKSGYILLLDILISDYITSVEYVLKLIPRFDMFVKEDNGSLFLNKLVQALNNKRLSPMNLSTLYKFYQNFPNLDYSPIINYYLSAIDDDSLYDLGILFPKFLISHMKPEHVEMMFKKLESVFLHFYFVTRVFSFWNRCPKRDIIDRLSELFEIIKNYDLLKNSFIENYSSISLAGIYSIISSNDFEITNKQLRVFFIFLEQANEICSINNNIFVVDVLLKLSFGNGNLSYLAKKLLQKIDISSYFEQRYVMEQKVKYKADLVASIDNPVSVLGYDINTLKDKLCNDSLFKNYELSNFLTSFTLDVEFEVLVEIFHSTSLLKMIKNYLSTSNYLVLNAIKAKIMVGIGFISFTDKAIVVFEKHEKSFIVVGNQCLNQFRDKCSSIDFKAIQTWSNVLAASKATRIKELSTNDMKCNVNIPLLAKNITLFGLFRKSDDSKSYVGEYHGKFIGELGLDIIPDGFDFGPDHGFQAIAISRERACQLLVDDCLYFPDLRNELAIEIANKFITGDFRVNSAECEKLLADYLDCFKQLKELTNSKDLIPISSAMKIHCTTTFIKERAINYFERRSKDSTFVKIEKWIESLIYFEKKIVLYCGKQEILQEYYDYLRTDGFFGITSMKHLSQYSTIPLCIWYNEVIDNGKDLKHIFYNNRVDLKSPELAVHVLFSGRDYGYKIMHVIDHEKNINKELDRYLNYLDEIESNEQGTDKFITAQENLDMVDNEVEENNILERPISNKCCPIM